MRNEELEKQIIMDMMLDPDIKAEFIRRKMSIQLKEILSKLPEFSVIDEMKRIYEIVEPFNLLKWDKVCVLIPDILKEILKKEFDDQDPFMNFNFRDNLTQTFLGYKIYYYSGSEIKIMVDA